MNLVIILGVFVLVAGQDDQRFEALERSMKNMEQRIRELEDKHIQDIQRIDADHQKVLDGLYKEIADQADMISKCHALACTAR